MKRTALRRSTKPLRSVQGLQRRRRINPVSKKQRRKPSNSRVLGKASDHPCVVCGGRAVAWHHRLPESRGGPTDRFNCVPVCFKDHAWVHGNVFEASLAGLTVDGSVGRGGYVGSSESYRRRYGDGRRGDPAA